MGRILESRRDVKADEDEQLPEAMLVYRCLSDETQML
jgi:hypothetical protein